MTARRAAGFASAAGAATALSLVLPWVRVGGRSRSSIDLIGSAGALDVIEGGVRVAVVATWFLVPALVSVAMLAAAADRPRAAALSLLPLGPGLLAVVAAAALSARSVLVWGAYLTAVAAVVTTVLAVVVLRRLRAESTSG